MNTGRTTSFFGCFLVGILMSKKNYDKIDVFLLSFLVVSDEKARESIFFGFITAVRLKKNTFFTFLLVLIFCLKIMNYFLCNLYNFVSFFMNPLLGFQFIHWNRKYVLYKNGYSFTIYFIDFDLLGVVM